MNSSKEYKAWPFLEAQKVLRRAKNDIKNNINIINGKRIIKFETGYGPSGLPHIGTFCEVFRTSLIIKALKILISKDEEINEGQIEIKLICFSDDIDGLKKIPSNIPNQGETYKYIGQPLTSVPDPFNQEESYGHFMNKKLRYFLDEFGLEYEFISSTQMYRSGQFDESLKKVMLKYEDLMAIMLPSLGEERQKTYSPFLPICKKTNKVLQAKVTKLDIEKSEITYIHPDTNEEVVTSVLSGECKLQWKIDFGMRWMHLGIDFEMYGKDHRPNSGIYTKICSTLGGTPPIQYFYELFLDEDGNKVSKSKGNSISIDEWLSYTPIESVALYAFQNPERAKRLFFDVIPKVTDEYIALNNEYCKNNDKSNYDVDSPIYLIHNTLVSNDKSSFAHNVPYIQMHNITFAMLLNLASICDPESPEIMWAFIKKYSKNIDQESPFINKLVQGAVMYNRKFIKPTRKYLIPDELYIKILTQIKEEMILLSHNNELSDEEVQNKIYAVGKRHYEPKELKIFFSTLYQILFGSTEGPRLGSFAKLFGIENFCNLIDRIINKSKIS